MSVNHRFIWWLRSDIGWFEVKKRLIIDVEKEMGWFLQPQKWLSDHMVKIWKSILELN